MKDKAVLFGWIIGLLILISMLWIFTQGLQTHYLLRTVNNVMIYKNDSRRLSGYVQQRQGRAGPLGYWFTITNSTDYMFVFSVFQDGVLVPLGAVVSADGMVKEVVPLSAHAIQIFDDMPKSILQIYINRIEQTALLNREGSNR